MSIDPQKDKKPGCYRCKGICFYHKFRKPRELMGSSPSPEYVLVFSYVDDYSSGPVFPCNAHGEVSLDTLSKSEQEYYLEVVLKLVEDRRVVVKGIYKRKKITDRNGCGK